MTTTEYPPPITLVLPEGSLQGIDVKVAQRAPEHPHIAPVDHCAEIEIVEMWAGAAFDPDSSSFDEATIVPTHVFIDGKSYATALGQPIEIQASFDDLVAVRVTLIAKRVLVEKRAR